ncbi:hypothetical protein HUJ04_001450, partial [Dendroctonus ponderosae]
MPLPKRRLYCSWHVDKAWRKNLSKIKNRECQAEVYKILRTLLEETDEKQFYELFSGAKNYLSNNSETKDFANYFFNNYENNIFSWAFCFRLHSGVNTNMHLERMHRTIKEIYCSQKKIKRLDHLIYILQKFIRDRLFDQLVIHHKGKVTSKIKAVRDRHQKSITLDSSKLMQSEQDDHFETCKCRLKCTQCDCCIHQFACSCSDNAIQWNICKHIHLLCSTRKESVGKFPLTSDAIQQAGSQRTSNNDIENIIISEVAKKKERVSNNDLEKAKLKDMIITIIDNASSSESLQYIRSQILPMGPTVQVLDNFNNIILLNKNLVEKAKAEKEPANKLMEPQLRLFPKKKKAQQSVA